MKNSLTDVAPETAPILLDVNLMIAVDPQTVRVVGGGFHVVFGTFEDRSGYSGRGSIMFYHRSQDRLCNLGFVTKDATCSMG